MPPVSSQDLARLRADITSTFESGVELVSIHRPAEVVGNKRDAEPVEVAREVAMKLWPAVGAGTQELLKTIPNTAGARIDMVGSVAYSVDIRHGDQVRLGTRKLYVVGLGRWNASTSLALSEVRPR
jgi:hypothetical protein